MFCDVITKILHQSIKPTRCQPCPDTCTPAWARRHLAWTRQQWHVVLFTNKGRETAVDKNNYWGLSRVVVSKTSGVWPVHCFIFCITVLPLSASTIFHVTSIDDFRPMSCCLTFHKTCKKQNTKVDFYTTTLFTFNRILTFPYTFKKGGRVSACEYECTWVCALEKDENLCDDGDGGDQKWENISMTFFSGHGTPTPEGRCFVKDVYLSFPH